MRDAGNSMAALSHSSNVLCGLFQGAGLHPEHAVMLGGECPMQCRHALGLGDATEPSIQTISEAFVQQEVLAQG